MTVILGIVLIGIKIRFTHPKYLVFRKSKVKVFRENFEIFVPKNFIARKLHLIPP